MSPSPSSARIQQHQGIHDAGIREIPASDLSDHPLLAHIPVWKRDEPDFNALVESIRERGLDYPVLLDSEQRVIDGRNRRNACAVLKRPVACRIVDHADVSSIIVSSLINRRHLTKGALAYLTAPLFEKVLEESKARRLANLRRGEIPESALSALSGRNGSDIAAKLGIGERLFDQAIKLRKMFDGFEKEVREKYEPRVLGPWEDENGELQDPVGLGYMINGLTSLVNDAAKKKNLGKRAQHDRLFIGFLPKLGLHWKKATDAQKEQIAARLKAEAMKWPEDMREGFAKAIRDAARADKA